MKTFFSICTVFVTFLIALFPSVSSKCAQDAVNLCINVLIPSLFPFIVCANLLMSLGITEKMARFFSKFTLFLFKINGCCAFPFVMGLISGYPVGMMTCCKLYSQKKLSLNEANRLMMFVNNSGPIFIISAVGLGVFSNINIGIILYISHIAAAFSVGILSRFFSDDKPSAATLTSSHSSPSNAVPESISSILTLCGYVIFFSVITGLLEKINILSSLSRLLSFTNLQKGDISLLSRGIFEITSALFSSEGASAEIAAFIISAGGISVLFQSMYFCRKSGLSVKPYIAGKILCGGFAALYCNLLLRLSPASVSVFSQTAENKLSLYMPYLFIFSLICAVFLFIFLRWLQVGKSAFPEKQNLTRTRS